MKIILTETQSKALLKRLRRIPEVRDTIEYQMEIQDPCNFDDGEEYADFCIGVGLSFFMVMKTLRERMISLPMRMRMKITVDSKLNN